MEKSLRKVENSKVTLYYMDFFWAVISKLNYYLFGKHGALFQQDNMM